MLERACELAQTLRAAGFLGKSLVSRADPGLKRTDLLRDRGELGERGLQLLTLELKLVAQSGEPVVGIGGRRAQLTLISVCLPWMNGIVLGGTST